MDKTHVIIFMLLACITSLNAQTKYSYQPMTRNQKSEIDNYMFAHNVSTFLVNDRIPLGPVSLTNVVNMVSYNPIEGTRLRISGETNSSFSKHLALSLMAAYGTKDNKFKYALGAAYNFMPKARSVYGFPCSTLSVNWEDNTYMPSYPNYDVAYFSFGSWDKFYFARKRQFSASYLHEFPSTFAVRPFFYHRQITSYMLYDGGNVTELIDPDYDYTNKSFGAELSYTPSRKGIGIFNILNSRFYAFQTQISLDYSYNIQQYIYKHEYNRLELSAQHRFSFKPMALDIKISGGKIFGESDGYMYFTPNYSLASVSNMFGFNCYMPGEYMYKQYVQTYTQLNLGGILLDNISFFKNFRPNEFINFKALFTENDDPYCEAGFGVDHIFGFLGLEVVKRIAKDNPYNMPQWSLKVRCSF
ncbi:MAG: hypothetical protein J6P44_01075 [Bacteroidales bacterium]|nr:hypothetical protein [Bacteroidales bacterium]